jgi:serine/threonine protein kinase
LEHTPQDVAIKFLKNFGGSENFEKEMKFLSKLRHKNIITFYGFMIEPHYGIILEFCKNFIFNF